MSELASDSLGELWVNLVERTFRLGAPLGDEGYELLGVVVSFPSATEADAVIERFGDRQMIAEMNRVFFTDEPNALGHSYARLMRGPCGRHDLDDVISLLRTDRLSKRAVVTLCGEGDGRVPCINLIQFLVRDGAVHVMYYARGQDAFRKFCADGLCVATLARTVAGALELPAGRVVGSLASSHVYHRDVPAIRQLLAQARAFLRLGEPTGAH
jgi:hypothetical protein